MDEEETKIWESLSDEERAEYVANRIRAKAIPGEIWASRQPALCGVVWGRQTADVLVEWMAQ